MVAAAFLRQVSLFSQLDEAALALVAEHMQPRVFRSGETIVEQGSIGDSMYVVRYGGVHVLIPDRRRQLSGDFFRIYLGPREVFGEIALITNAPRSATIVAAMDSECWVMSRRIFQQLLTEHLALAQELLQVIAGRLLRTNLGGTERDLYPVVAVVNPADGPDALCLAAQLTQSLAQEVRATVLLLDATGTLPDAQQIATWTSFLAAADADPAALHCCCRPLAGGSWQLTLPLGLLAGRPDADPLPMIVSTLRECCDFIVIATTEPRSAIETRLLGQAGLLLIAGPGGSSFDFAGACARIAKQLPGSLRHAVVRRANRTSKLDADVERSWTIPAGEQNGGRGELGQLTRLISGTSIGLALGGGAARGLAHLGVIDTLRRADVPCDVVGGTSFGGLIAAMVAIGWDVEKMIGVCRATLVHARPMNDYALPFTSLIRGKKAERMVIDCFGDVRIEDLPIPYFAVAADLISGREVTVDRGPVWEAIMASISIPGIFPPRRHDGRHLLVDGMIVNNLPGDGVRTRGAQMTVAVNVSVIRGERFDYTRPRPLGPVRRWLARLPVLCDLIGQPSIVRIIIQAEAISSQEITSINSRKIDLVIHPDVGGFDLFAFHRLDQLIDAGRIAAENALPDIEARRAILREFPNAGRLGNHRPPPQS